MLNLLLSLLGDVLRPSSKRLGELIEKAVFSQTPDLQVAKDKLYFSYKHFDWNVHWPSLSQRLIKQNERQSEKLLLENLSHFDGQTIRSFTEEGQIARSRIGSNTPTIQLPKDGLIETYKYGRFGLLLIVFLALVLVFTVISSNILKQWGAYDALWSIAWRELKSFYSMRNALGLFPMHLIAGGLSWGACAVFFKPKLRLTSDGRKFIDGKVLPGLLEYIIEKKL